MGKKDTENAVYVAVISGAVGLLWDMLLNPCGKHWIPFFNNPSVDVACFISKGGLRLIPPIPPIGRGRGGSGRYKSRAGELSDLAKGKRGGDGDDEGGLATPFRPSDGGDGGSTRREKPPRRDEPERSLEDILRGITKETGKQATKSSRRRGSSETTMREEQESLDDLIAQAGDVFSGGKVESFGESIFKSINDAFKGLADLFKNPPATPLEELLKGEKPLGEIIEEAIKGGGRGVRVRYSGLEFYPYEYYQ